MKSSASIIACNISKQTQNTNHIYYSFIIASNYEFFYSFSCKKERKIVKIQLDIRQKISYNNIYSGFVCSFIGCTET